jgi:CheY-like chemotaxis protein
MAKILLVEDDQTMRTILKTLLEIEGHQVATLPDRKKPDEILPFINGDVPDIMLVDVHLQNQSFNGYELVKRLRAEGGPELSHVRVVMSSGMDVKELCIQSGADAFLMKPYMPDELIELLSDQ